MQSSATRARGAALLGKQSVRYVINGLVATGVHFVVLTFNLRVLGWDSAGAANLTASVFGIATSFLGSRYFVFHNSTEMLLRQLYRFLFLYSAMAVLHGALMYVWADHCRLNYVAGFVIATGVQVLFGYWGNKRMVFKA